MRQPLVLSLLLILFVALGWSIAHRHGVGTPVAVARSDGALGSLTAGASGASGSQTGTLTLGLSSSGGKIDGGLTSTAAPPIKVLGLGRPLKLIGSSWDLLAPAVAGNGGAKVSAGGVFAARGIELSIAVADRGGIERALSRGGADPEGADLALVPLPTFVESYARLRALQPEVVWVVASSRGREVLAGSKPALLIDPPSTGDIPVAAASDPPEPLFLAMFCLDLAGVPATRIKIIAPGSPGAQNALWAASLADVNRQLLEGKKVLLGTADVPHLIPLVLIVPHGWAQAHLELLTGVIEGWLAGVATLAADPPRAARLIGAEKDSPDPVALLERFGQLEPATLDDNLELLGDKADVTIDDLFRRTWGIWRTAGELDTPTPLNSVVTTLVVEQLDKSHRPRPPKAAPAPVKPATEARVLLIHRLPAKADEAALTKSLGFLAKLFERSTFRVAGKWDPRHLKAVLDQSAAAGRAVVSPTVPPPRWSAVIEVLAGT